MYPSIKIVAVQGSEVVIRQEERTGGDGITEKNQRGRILERTASGKHTGNQYAVGGHDAPDAAVVEVANAESAALQIAENAASDQVPRDDKEDIHADKAAGAEARQDVE